MNILLCWKCHFCDRIEFGDLMNLGNLFKDIKEWGGANYFNKLC